VALGRKNALFAGADSGGEHLALIARNLLCHRLVRAADDDSVVQK
jgi:hypothetical protein